MAKVFQHQEPMSLVVLSPSKEYLIVGMSSITLVYDLRKKSLFELKSSLVQADLSIANLMVGVDVRGNVHLTDLECRFSHKIRKTSSRK